MVCLPLWSAYVYGLSTSAYLYSLPTSMVCKPQWLPTSMVYLPLWFVYLYGLSISMICLAVLLLLPLLLLHPFAVYNVSPVSKVNWAAVLSPFGQTVHLRLSITSKVCLPLWPNQPLRSAYLHGLTNI